MIISVGGLVWHLPPAKNVLLYFMIAPMTSPLTSVMPPSISVPYGLGI